MELNEATLDKFSNYCDEFLIHGVDVEGKGSGMDEELVRILSDWKRKIHLAMQLHTLVVFHHLRI